MELKTTIAILLFLLSASSCRSKEKVEGYYQKLKDRVAKRANYKNSALILARENRILKSKLNRLRFQLEEIKGSKGGRGIASIGKKERGKGKRREAMVRIDGHHWPFSKALMLAEKSFKEKNYGQSFSLF